MSIDTYVAYATVYANSQEMAIRVTGISPIGGWDWNGDLVITVRLSDDPSTHADLHYLTDDACWWLNEIGGFTVDENDYVNNTSEDRPWCFHHDEGVSTIKLRCPYRTIRRIVEEHLLGGPFVRRIEWEEA